MPLQDRLDPFGKFIATPACGLLMRNRGGRLHRGRAPVPLCGPCHDHLPLFRRALARYGSVALDEFA